MERKHTIERTARQITTHVKTIAIILVSTAIFAGIGYLANDYFLFVAQSAVEVRPNLAHVTFMQAVSTEHGTDWLYYHHPGIMQAVTVAVSALVGLGFGFIVARQR